MMVACIAFALLSGPPRNRPVILNETASGKSVQIKLGQQVRLELKSNPTTGYSWSDPKFAPKGLIELEKNVYVANSNPKHLAGSGGATVITMRAKKLGVTEMTTLYRRAFEKTPKPAGRVVLTFTVVK